MYKAYFGHNQGDPSIRTKQKIRNTAIIIKAVLAISLFLQLRALKKSTLFHHWNMRGINPAPFCLEDQAHLVVDSLNRELFASPIFRACLQVVSSLMIDSAFIYFGISW